MNPRRFLILASVSVALLIVTFVTVNILHEREQALADARDRLISLNLALAEQLERSLQGVDLALGEVVHALDENKDWTTPALHQSLKGYVAALPQIRAIAVVDANGNIVSDSAQFPASPIHLGDREYFKLLQADPHRGMYVSVPVKSRRDNEWTVVLARPVADKAGNFRGLVFARMHPRYFQELYQNVLHLPGSAVCVLRRDAVLLFRQPHIENLVGTSFAEGLLFKSLLAQAEQGTFETHAISDKELRLFSYATLRAYPLVLPVSQTMDAILAGWKMAATRALVVVGLMLLGTFWLMRRLLAAMQAQETADASLRLAASVFEHTQEAILVTDAERQIVDINRAFTRLTGYTLEELRGKTPAVLKSGRHDQAFYDQMWASIGRSGEWRGEIWNTKKNGEPYASLLNISTVRNPQGAITHYTGLYADITALKQTQQHLETLANYDPLTGLPNRMLLADRVEQAIARANRAQKLLAICFLDLDGFKPINDRHGHDVGDQLLVQVAQRLREAIRAGDTAARLGGDEFVLLLSDLDTIDECEITLARVMDELSAPIAIGALQLSVSASIGVAVYPLDDGEPDMLLRHADHAMYQAKEEGRSRVAFFDTAKLAAQPTARENAAV
jgi:diguanylate cyclase (GGDEF)-like protein/PAS domain S-box-containing protein